MPALLTGVLRRQRNAVVAPYIRGDVLDIGCGYGSAIPFVAPHGRYVGVELHVDLVTWLRQTFPEHEFHQRDIEREPLALGEARFDTVLIVAVIEHLVRPAWVLTQVHGHLRPGGRLIVTTPTPLGEAIHRWGTHIGLFCEDAVEDHKRFYDRQAMEVLLSTCGFHIADYRRFQLGANQLFVAKRVEK